MIQGLRLIHALPGRTRMYAPFSHLPEAKIEAMFRLHPFIRAVTYTKETGSLLLYHDPSLSWQDIVRFIQRKWGLKNHKECIDSPKGQVQVRKHLRSLGLSAAAFLLDAAMSSRGARMGFGKLLNLPAITAVYVSLPIIRHGIEAILRDRRANADTLTATAILAAILKGKPASGLIIVIMSTISELLTEYTAERTRNHITDMMKLDVTFAWLDNGEGKEIKVPVETIKPGDTVAVFLGEKISVDGVVAGGAGTVDESSITGEYMPREVFEGSYVYAGSVLKSGQVKIKVKHAGDNTAITRIIKLIEEAQNKQAPIQSIADRMSASLVPVSFLMAGIVYFMTRNWDRVLNMLFIDFSCGLKLSTATAISACIGKAAKHGILIKGGQYIERMAQVDTVVLDKTGTVTEGRPTIKEVIPFNGFTAREVIRYAASAEEHSSHPIAESILRQAKQWGVEIPEHDQIETLLGRGIKAKVEGKSIMVGSDRLMEESQVSMEAIEMQESTVFQEGGNLVYIACDSRLMGIISIHDPIRAGMKRAINRMRRYDIDEIVMLTGDKKHAAKKISQNLLLDSYHAEVLPAEKAEFIKRYREKSASVMMVGDGINDAPALAFAHVGVTMGGKRTDIAVEASDVTITSDDPLTLPAVIGLSKKSMQVIQQNFLATIIVNSVAMLLGGIGTISPIVGAVIHNTSTIAVVLNSSKILWLEIKK